MDRNLILSLVMAVVTGRSWFSWHGGDGGPGVARDPEPERSEGGQVWALANREKGFTVVMVVHEAGRVVGYHGLAPTAVLPATLPRTIRTGQPPSPVPCLLLGRLATNLASAG